MSNAIVSMMQGPQPRNHNAKREIMSMIDVLRAVSGRVTTRGDSCIEELELVAATMVKIIRGINADVDFGLPNVGPLNARIADLEAQLAKALEAIPSKAAEDVPVDQELVQVAEPAPARRRGRPAKVVAPE